MSVERKKVVLVTGASGGIGYAAAIEFAKRGYNVFAGARRLEPMKPLQETYGINIFKLDVSSLESVKKAKEYIIEQTGDSYLDILYNNAGQSCTFPCTDVQDEDFKMCYEVNVFGPMRTVREFSPLIINAKGTIGFTGSVSGFIPFPFSATYSGTKAAINQYANTLQFEMIPFGVKVINFVTGGVKTSIADTRPLPEDSLYNVTGMREAFLERQAMAARNQPMPAHIYAKKVVNDFEHAKLGGGVQYYRGKGATMLYYVSILVRTNVLQYFLMKRFKLIQVFAAIREKYSKKKLS